MGWSAELRSESETVEELLDKLEESERRGELETFEELLDKLEKSEARELLVWHSMHGIRPEERVSCPMPPVSVPPLFHQKTVTRLLCQNLAMSFIFLVLI